MDNEMNYDMEKLRHQFEALEDDSQGKEEDIKQLLNGLNAINIKVLANGTFSNNEEFKDIKTEDIKYLLAPYYQSELIQKFMENRDIRLEQGLQFYDAFYKKLDTYQYLTKEQKDQYKTLRGLNTNDHEEDEKDKMKKAFEQMSLEREEKIKQFRYKKALSEKLKVFFVIMTLEN
jgi:hypothetical protein